MILDFGRAKRNSEEVQAHDVWKALRNAQERLFCSALMDSFDPTFAAMTAYEMKNQEDARKSSFNLLKKAPIRAVLDFWLKKTPQEKLDDDIQRELRSRRKEPLAARLRALQMRAQLLGLRMEIPRDDKSADSKAASVRKNSEPDAPIKEFDPSRRYEIGDLFVYDAQVVRATKVENGVPTQAEPAVEVSQ